MSSTKIISLLLCFLFITSLLFIPVSAAEDQPVKEYKQVDGFFHWLVRQTNAVGEWLGISSYSSELYCAESEDNRHYSTDYQFVEGIGDVETGYYYCICDYCGHTFRAYEQDVKQSYDNYVDRLDESLVSNDGNIYWKFNDQTTREGCEKYEEYSITKEKKSLVTSDYQFHYFRDDYHYYLKYCISDRYQGDEFTSAQNNNFSFFVKTPGIYKLRLNNSIKSYSHNRSIDSYTTFSIYDDDGSLYYTIKFNYYDSYSYQYPYDKNFSFNTGNYNVVINTDLSWTLINEVAYNKLYDAVIGPYWFAPVETVNTKPSNSESRTGTIYGNYGITGDDGTIIHSEDNYIFDETNNTYNNLYTDNTKTVKNWSYDYSKREYNLTFDDGSAATVTYGDENVTINENNTVYNVYYMSDDEASDHIHEYNEEIISAPTCTLAGQSKYTCGICEKTYTQDKPALGHKWTVKQTVQTQYGDNGELVQQGYTIYKCSTCGEEYKTESGAAPPGGSSGGSSGTGDGDQSGESGGQSWLDKLGEFVGGTLGKLISLIGSVISGILDGLISLVTDVINSLGGVVELFGSFGPAMGNLWSWLPAEIVTVMVAGVSIIVLVSVVKAFI